ncbi:RbsD/FucU family protein [Curtobacterium sp. Leaf261]|uniref:RbsD/FucU family protein n=1 Tax=Curtobacterium sp. Leaf261 TaxID=1736311 RepID=UPI0019108D23|nr:RbsD/FucU domain-containing protein [Curtobacterium sp. Leaf261]
MRTLLSGPIDHRTTTERATMLKGLDPLLTPDLLWALSAMGHGDTLAVVDANYPAHALHDRVITTAGADMGAAVRAIASVFPVDTSVEPAVAAMVPEGGATAPIASHDVVARALAAAEGREVPIEPVPRHDFYARAKGAFAVVLTGELSGYACFVLTKGVTMGAVVPD